MDDLILLRHGPRAFSNRKGKFGSKQLDSPLSAKGIEQVEKWASLLVQYLPVPYTLVSSPFYRARQTAEILQRKMIEKFPDENIPISILPQVGEYLGNNPHPRKNEFYHQTWNEGIIFDKNEKEFTSRANSFISEIGQVKNVIVVTHGWFISKVENYINSNGTYPNFFEGISLRWEDGRWEVNGKITWDN